MNMTSDPTLGPLNRLLGTWTTQSIHPAVPGVIMHGTVTIKWLEGEMFLIHHARTTGHPEIRRSRMRMQARWTKPRKF